MGEDLTSKDVFRMALAVMFGNAISGFLDASGVLDGLAESFGGSFSMAYLTIMIITGILLVKWW